MEVLKVKARVALVFVFAMLLAGCQTAPIQFALIGDNPYEPASFPRYERMIDDINASPGIDWVVHLGDMKDGIGDCSDESFEALYRMNARFNAPFVLTPGDNDWFDCKREESGGWNRLDRLDRLREIFYAEPVALPVVSQRTSERYGDFVENVYWMDQGVMFATVHLVGVSGEEGGMDLHHDVQDAAVEWLETVFDEALEADALGVFLATQADL